MEIKDKFINDPKLNDNLSDNDVQKKPRMQPRGKKSSRILAGLANKLTEEVKK